jgi:post-segregation antitoxin (ccd killing protein)
MGHFAIRTPNELRERMRAVRLNWSEVVRDAIEARLAQAERQRLLEQWQAAARAKPPVAAGTAVRGIRNERDG